MPQRVASIHTCQTPACLQAADGLRARQQSNSTNTFLYWLVLRWDRTQLGSLHGRTVSLLRGRCCLGASSSGSGAILTHRCCLGAGPSQLHRLLAISERQSRGPLRRKESKASRESCPWNKRTEKTKTPFQKSLCRLSRRTPLGRITARWAVTR